MNGRMSILEDLGVGARVVALDDGQVLVRQGDEAHEVFLLRSGSLVVSLRTDHGDTTIGRISPGDLIGEVTVVVGGRRSATLQAEGAAEVVGIERREFERWLDEHPDLADEIVRRARDRIDQNQVAAIVAEQIGTTDPGLVQAIVERVEWCSLEPGDVLFRQGDPSDAAYFVVSGRLLVLIADGDGDATGDDLTREVGRGEVVGELGLLDRSPRSATVRAVRDTTLARFPTDVFDELVSEHPSLLLHVTRGMVARLRDPQRRLADRAGSITVMVLADGAPEALVGTMAAEIARHGSVSHLWSDQVDHLLDRQGIAQVQHVQVPRLEEFLHETDLGHDHVVLEADRDVTPWTRRVLRQADRVVLVVSASPDSDERRRITAATEVLADVDHIVRVLAVLHPGDADRPRGTAALMDLVGADDVVHLRAGREDDVRRLARLASGHGVGLVLSGGGARGFAHLGAHRALVEAGVPIDRVGGASMGALMAAGIALDLPPDEMEARVVSLARRLLDYTLPAVSLLKGGRIARNLEATFGDHDLEDLWLPCYCVSTNLTSSRLEVHRRGDATKFIRASVAIPGVLPPVSHDGSLLVDGGVLNNLPVAVMRNHGGIGTVIAVDVAPPEGPRAHADFGVAVSGWRALLDRRIRHRRTFPDLSTVLLRSMLTGAVHNQREQLRTGAVDLMLHIGLPGVGLLEFSRVRSVASAGYETVNDTVHEWARRQRWLEVRP